MKKTLNELLQDKKYQKANIKVGSKGGSSFWYCGKCNLAYSLPEINKAREKLIRQSKGTLHQLQYRKKHLDELYDETLERAKKKVKNFAEYKKKLEIKKERERALLPKKIASVEYDINVHLLDREVKEVVYGISPDESPCWIIYVKGNERGAYWTIAEYNKRRKNNDLPNYD